MVGASCIRLFLFQNANIVSAIWCCKKYLNMAKKLFNDFIKLPDKAPKAEPELGLKKVFIYNQSQWKPIKQKEFFDLKVNSILSDTTRIMVEFEYQNQKIFIVNNDGDYNGLRAKYPNALILHIVQIFKFFNKLESKEDFYTQLPKMFLAFKSFEGAKLVDVKCK